MHQRTVIRDKAKELLLDNTLAGIRVYRSRVKPYAAKKLPAIGVYLNGGPADHGGRSPRRYKREEDLVIEIVAAELVDTDVDQFLDDLSEQVENIFLADETMSGTVWDCELTDTDLRPTKNGDRVFGSARLTFRVTYETVPTDPSADDFLEADVEWDEGPAPDGEMEAEDTIKLQEETP
ncbi:MAG: hypothetical protein JEY79_05560 [Pseudodesulfovibrio sp.]|nr:hypothetical protein [Pseudodesulfovibrio sp.]